MTTKLILKTDLSMLSMLSMLSIIEHLEHLHAVSEFPFRTRGKEDAQ